MNKQEYIEYLKTNAYYMLRYAEELEDGSIPESHQYIEYPVFSPEELTEMEAKQHAN